MEITHILSSLKRNNVIAILIVLQIAVTVMIVSNSVTTTLSVLEGWLTPTLLQEENLVTVRNRFIDTSMNMDNQIREDLHDIREIPGVINVTTTVEVPFESNISFRWVFMSDEENALNHAVSVFDFDENGPAVLDLELLEGRWYEPHEIMRGDITDITLPAIALVSETMAKVMFPDQSAVGKTIFLNRNGAEPLEIIGVYKDFMGGDRAVYSSVPYQTLIRPMVAWGLNYETNYLLKVEPGTAPRLLEIVEETLYQTPGRYIVYTEVLTRTLKRLYDGRSSFSFTMLGISLIGVLITSLGIIGLVTLSVSQRRQHIGTRRALGATKWQVMRYFLIEISLLSVMGLAVGFILSYGLNYVLATDFNNPGLIKLQHWLSIGVVLWLVNLAAARIPARRATQVSPATVTRGA